MKIGIITYWWSKDNYGQQLQCYALQKYLQDAGHDTYLIRYDPTNDGLDSIKLHKHLLNRIKAIVRKTVNDSKNDERKFEDFRKRYILQSEKIYYYYDELVKNPPEADVYIVGSDQVWRSCIEERIRAYFLDFGHLTIKRISYAASFGREILDNKVIKIISPLLQKFNYVSVREKSGLNICKQLGINNVELVPDPTILLNADFYRALYKNEKIKVADKSYCFLYLLQDKRSFFVKTVYDWAKKKNLEVVYVSANLNIDRYEKTYATIPEWIYLLENAEYVITNSYHCAIFSLLFKKKFGVIPRLGTMAGMNTRLDSLFEFFQTGKRWLDTSDFSMLEEKTDWQFVFEKFRELRDNCKLLDILSPK